MRWSLFGLLGLVACSDGGGVALHLRVPADPALDPFAQSVAELTLSASADDRIIYVATRSGPVPGQTLDFGRVPIADGVGFELMVKAPTGRVIGFGRSAALVDVGPDDAVDVELEMRRPFSYVSGAGALLAIDGTREPGRDYASTIAVSAPVTAAVVAPTGDMIIAAVGNGLERVSTSTHVVDGERIELGAPIDDLTVSADGRWVIASHRVEPTGISIVALDGSREPVFVPTSSASSIAIHGDTVWVLQDRLASIFCVGESTILTLSLADPLASGSTIVLGTAATDLAVDPATGAVMVALACLNRVVMIADPQAPPVALLDVPGASAVAVARGRVWVMGHRDGEGAHLILASVAVDGGAVDILEMPTLEERAEAVALSQTGQGGLIQMTADLAAAGEIAVLPDGEHVAILVTAVYGTLPAGDAGGGQPIVPKLTMITYEYQLVQLDTGLAAQRLRVYCSIEWDPGALLDDFACAQAPGQDEAAISFIPTDLTVLYGSR
ncbi:MAG TPA: hypothetical protein VML75_25290 [Kofleriaceae bacterium]|nr:hypothetical protein [Kofleriaceae bacterium]